MAQMITVLIPNEYDQFKKAENRTWKNVIKDGLEMQKIKVELQQIKEDYQSLRLNFDRCISSRLLLQTKLDDLQDKP